MILRAVQPHPLLRPFIQSFSFRAAVITDVLRFPIPARPVQFMEFYLRDRYRIIDFASEVVTTTPSVVLLGQQTRRLSDLHLQGDYAVFTIKFQPTGFHRLFGIPMCELTDQAIAAEAVIGSAVHELHEQLEQSISLSERVDWAEKFLRPRAMQAPQILPVAWMAQALLTSHGLSGLDTLQIASGLSLRQLERQFSHSVGVPPKRYARIIRFQRAVTLGQLYGEGSWAQIAAEAGYFDQMHLIKDFYALASQTPTHLHQAIRATESWDPFQERTREE